MKILSRHLAVGLTVSALVLVSVEGSGSVAIEPNEQSGNENAANPIGELVTPDQDPLELLGVSKIVLATNAVPIPMTDGVRLSALIIRPRDTPEGLRMPTILIKTPYVAASEFSSPLARAVLSRLIRKGYAVAVVNDRGTQWSEGEFHLQRGAKQDGYDTVSWLVHQPWSNGKIGSFGCSSSSENQWALATMNHPAHRAMVLMSGTAGIGTIPGYREQGIFYTGGVPSLDWTWWYLKSGHQYRPHLPAGIGQEERARLAAVYSSHSHQPNKEDPTGIADHLPSMDILKAVNAPSTDFDHLITLSPTDGDWNDYDFLREGESTRVPGLLIDSWYATLHAYGTTKAFEYLSGNSPNQYLVMGPTAHCDMGTETQKTMVGDRDVGDARFDYTSLIVNWFDHWLRGEHNATDSLPKVQYYPLASNKWRTATAWPIPGTKVLRLFLVSAGSANSIFGDGRLDQHPGGGKPYDRFVYDPMNPVPSKGGGCCTENVARDQSDLEARNDVLVYTTASLTKDLDVAGYISASLFLASSAPDTDVMIKIVDVYPDGRAFNILDTALRLRYRDGYAAPKLMIPGSIYKVVLDEMAVASHFPAGHRIRIEVTSSNFPNYERNLNTGGPNFSESHPVIASNKIYHDASHRSFISLPVVNASE
jgi:putative CocE/NonD family hydrolase